MATSGDHNVHRIRYLRSRAVDVDHDATVLIEALDSDDIRRAVEIATGIITDLYTLIDLMDH
ncbi:hypothetical protein [Haloglycomyces albus]|uniref:hypothetical protein n=1 Tax=Haloglycomyces albus TaxID=526067 RepID=UPI00046D839D|nr:hypothetical protein [Haloglycomyces albus]